VCKSILYFDSPALFVIFFALFLNKYVGRNFYFKNIFQYL